MPSHIDCPMKVNDNFDMAVNILPQDLKIKLKNEAQHIKNSCEEIRLRLGKSPSLLIENEERELHLEKITAKDLSQIIETATRASAHTALSQTSSAFISLNAGSRLGICGEATVVDGKMTGIRKISSLALRIARDNRGCADKIFPMLCENGFSDTLIISPPSYGKTTVLREIIRLLSNDKQRVAVIDERYEIAGMSGGEQYFDLGKCTDVMSGARKKEAAMYLIRAMNPQILGMDEISSAADIEAIDEAVACGVTLLATCHGRDVETLYKRPVYKNLLDRKIFSKALIISLDERKKREYKVVNLL